jgi:hypothetical protein
VLNGALVFLSVHDVFPHVFTFRERNLPHFLSRPRPIFVFPSLISFCVFPFVSNPLRQCVSVVTMETFTVSDRHLSLL